MIKYQKYLMDTFYEYVSNHIPQEHIIIIYPSKFDIESYAFEIESILRQKGHKYPLDKITIKSFYTLLDEDVASDIKIVIDPQCLIEEIKRLQQGFNKIKKDVADYAF